LGLEVEYWKNIGVLCRIYTCAVTVTVLWGSMGGAGPRGESASLWGVGRRRQTQGGVLSSGSSVARGSWWHDKCAGVKVADYKGAALWTCTKCLKVRQDRHASDRGADLEVGEYRQEEDEQKHCYAHHPHPNSHSHT
jgi:hypothetical protein